MTQLDFVFAPPKADELFKFGSQNYRVYEKLFYGGTTTGDLLEMKPHVACYTHRISDIREKLKPYDYDVVCKPVSKTNNYYSICKIQDTSYEDEMDRATKYIDKYKGY